MKKLRCLVVDDKPLAIDILADYIGKTSFLELGATSTNPIHALQLVKEKAIELVFLDIQMPELNGLDFIKIVGKQCRVVLTTAYSKYALDGYEHDVVDYLLKPIPFERFYRAAEKARQLIMTGERAEDIPTAESSPEYLFVKTEYRIQKINYKDIIYIEALQNYIAIHTPGEKMLSLLTMKKMEEQLPQREFTRVHKSFIVSLWHISSVERARIFIGDAVIPIGDNYRESFYNRIGAK